MERGDGLVGEGVELVCGGERCKERGREGAGQGVRPRKRKKGKVLVVGANTWRSSSTCS